MGDKITSGFAFWMMSLIFMALIIIVVYLILSSAYLSITEKPLDTSLYGCEGKRVIRISASALETPEIACSIMCKNINRPGAVTKGAPYCNKDIYGRSSPFCNCLETVWSSTILPLFE